MWFQIIKKKKKKAGSSIPTAWFTEFLCEPQAKAEREVFLQVMETVMSSTFSAPSGNITGGEEK